MFSPAVVTTREYFQVPHDNIEIPIFFMRLSTWAAQSNSSVGLVLSPYDTRLPEHNQLEVKVR